MNNICTKIILCFGVATLLLGVADSSKYTQKELEELRKFYYDDLDEYGDSIGPSSDEKLNNNKDRDHDSSSASNRPESRSSARKSSEDGDGTTQESSEKTNSTDKPLGPGEFIKDARKYLDAGRKAIDRAAERMRIPLPPFPRARASRASGGQLIQHVDKWVTDDSKSSTEKSKEGEEENEENSSNDNDKSSTKTPEESPNQRKENGHSIFKNPFEELGNDASGRVADAGGKILSILNKLTPPPVFGLPTPLPNLEDFGG